MQSAPVRCSTRLGASGMTIPTQAELEQILGAACFAALQAFLEANGLSIVRLPKGSLTNVKSPGDLDD